MTTCDVGKVPIINDLLAVPSPRRDAAWRRRFFQEVVDASFAAADPQVFVGPDGFPYFALHSPKPNTPFDSFCLSSIGEFALANGTGAAINPYGTSVDWAFSYGDLLTLHMFQRLEVEAAAPPSDLSPTETLTEDEVVLVGQPSESLLPRTARAAISAHLRQRHGIKDPGVYLMLRPTDNPAQQLVFSVFRNECPTDEAFRFVLQSISWFLPRHYVIVALEARDKALAEFEPL